MTALEMQLRFEQKIQNHITKDLDIRTIDVEWFLNRGQDLWVDDIYNKYKGQEELRKRLSTIIIASVLNLNDIIYVAKADGLHPYSTNIIIPSDVKYVLDESVYADTGTFDSNYVIAVKPVDAQYYNKQFRNPYKKPNDTLIWRMDVGYLADNGVIHELIAHNATYKALLRDSGSYYNLTYIKVPSRIAIMGTPANCEINEDYHDEIIDYAVKFALEVYQISGSLRATQNNV